MVFSLMSDRFPAALPGHADRDLRRICGARMTFPSMQPVDAA